MGRLRWPPPQVADGRCRIGDASVSRHGAASAGQARDLATDIAESWELDNRIGCIG